MLNEIFSLIDRLQNIVVSHELREANSMADWLAKSKVDRVVPFIAWL